MAAENRLSAMGGFDLVSDTDAGFDPGTGWHEIQQYHDLLL